MALHVLRETGSRGGVTAPCDVWKIDLDDLFGDQKGELGVKQRQKALCKHGSRVN